MKIRAIEDTLVLKDTHLYLVTHIRSVYKYTLASVTPRSSSAQYWRHYKWHGTLNYAIWY